MNDQETIARFIFMRSQGWSFNRITTELGVSKPTLIKWSRQHQFEIQNLSVTETEALAERVFGQRHQRWEALARQLKRLEDEIESATWKKSPPRACMASRPGCAPKSTASSVRSSLSRRPRTFPPRNSLSANPNGRPDPLWTAVTRHRFFSLAHWSAMVACAPP